MVILDVTVVNVALPAISRGLHATTTDLAWVVDSYSLVFAALLLSSGSFADHRGAKRAFQIGIVLFALASVACGLASSTSALIVARGAQGVGAALTVPSSLSLLQVAYTDRAVRARAFGVWGAVAGIGAGAGPVVGGALVTELGWRSVFFVNVPVALVGLALVTRVLPLTPRRSHGLDPGGQIAGAACLVGITLALVEAGSSGWTASIVVVGLIVFVTAGLAFVAIEQRVQRPMLPLSLFASPTFRTASVVGLFINFGFYGELFVMSLYLQQIRGFSPLLTGVALLPQMAMAVVGSTVSGWVMTRTGSRPPMVVGLCLGAVGLLSLSGTSVDSTYWVLVVPLLAIGLGMSLTMPAATAAIMEAAPLERGGIASGTLNAARQVGGVVGVALLGTFVAHRASFVTGFRVDMDIAAGVFVVGALLTIAGIDRSPMRPANLVASGSRRLVIVAIRRV